MFVCWLVCFSKSRKEMFHHNLPLPSFSSWGTAPRHRSVFYHPCLSISECQLPTSYKSVCSFLVATSYLFASSQILYYYFLLLFIICLLLFISLVHNFSLSQVFFFFFLIPYVAPSILMTCFITGILNLLLLFPSSSQSTPAPLLSGHHQLVLCIHTPVSAFFVHLFICFSESTYK